MEEGHVGGGTWGAHVEEGHAGACAHLSSLSRRPMDAIACGPAAVNRQEPQPGVGAEHLRREA
eukprot:768618-Prymnesium_polylepis.1